MKHINYILFLIIAYFACGTVNETSKTKYLTEVVPDSLPLEFAPIIVPENKLIHKGIFSPDLESYYYTISDTDFQKFDVYKVQNKNEKWSDPVMAFFNSDYGDHGMSFSPDGNTLYFSSTRPVPLEGIPSTWHIWKSEKIDGTWSDPTFVDIPNLREKLVSHPTITNGGTLYFHSSNLDYSEMDIYRASPLYDGFTSAEIVEIPSSLETGKCTPYISPEEDYLIFAEISDQLHLKICYNDRRGGWVNTKYLSSQINDKGQGNPYVTPDQQYLFFTTGKHAQSDWQVKWVAIADAIKIY